MDDLLADFISEQQAAEILGKNLRTLRRWAVTRFGPPRIKVGRTVRYRKSTLCNWLASLESESWRRRRR